MSLQSMRWGERQTLMFVKLFFSHKCLWDTRDADYKVDHKRVEAINDIIKKFYAWTNIVIDEEVISRKVRCLRSTYSQELAKIRKKRAQGFRYQSTLKWFKVWHRCLPGRTASEFPQLKSSNENACELEETNHSIDGSSSQELEETGGTDLEDSSRELHVTKEEREDHDLIQSEEIDDSSTTWLENKTKAQELITNSKTEPFVMSDNDYVLLVKSEPEELPFILKRRKHKRHSYFDDKTKISKDLQQLNRYSDADVKEVKEDEFEIFGKFIASQLRNMGLQRALRAQLKIQSIVSETKLNSLMNN